LIADEWSFRVEPPMKYEKRPYVTLKY